MGSLYDENELQVDEKNKETEKFLKCFVTNNITTFETIR